MHPGFFVPKNDPAISGVVLCDVQHPVTLSDLDEKWGIDDGDCCSFAADQILKVRVYQHRCT
jgi:hypothetical protein